MSLFRKPLHMDSIVKLKDRIEELERRLRDLEARPVYVPVPYAPQPWQPAHLWQVHYPAPWHSPFITTSQVPACAANPVPIKLGLM